jgi:hypothetical protein
VSDEELCVPFKEFPWFKDASVSAILKVEGPQPHHLYWPELDVESDIRKSFRSFREDRALPSAPADPAKHAAELGKGIKGAV